MKRVYQLLGAMLCCSIALGQQTAIEVPLTERTPLDSKSTSVLPLQHEASETLKLPDTDLDGAAYLEIFYSWEIDEDDAIVSILVVPDEDGQRFYVDRNNDEDLTNDGDPIAFPFSENEVAFYFNATDNPEQRTGRLLQRVPRFAADDPAQRVMYVNSEGDLAKAWVTHTQRRHPDFEGKAHTFFFEAYIDLSRGSFELDGQTYAVGIYDFNQDGRFDRVSGSTEHKNRFDRLLIDLGQDGELSFDVTTEMFRLDDVFEIGDQSYRVAEVDAFGASLSLEETESAATAYFLEMLEDKREEEGGIVRGAFDERFWDLTLTTLHGKTVDLADLRGQFVLLNFWGEWCRPCVAEIPALVETRAAWPEAKVQIVGMLKAENLDRAKVLIEETGMTWPQVLLTDELAEGFRITRYPTNLLILPDGKTCIQAGHVSTEFFERQLGAP